MDTRSTAAALLVQLTLIFELGVVDGALTPTAIALLLVRHVANKAMRE
jgi:hypothetical protein